MALHPSSIATHAEYRSSSHMLLLKKQSDVLGPRAILYLSRKCALSGQFFFD